MFGRAVAAYLTRSLRWIVSVCYKPVLKCFDNVIELLLVFAVILL